jgi:hypothetical protein
VFYFVLKKADSGRPALAHRTRKRWVQASRNDVKRELFDFLRLHQILGDSLLFGI